MRNRLPACVAFAIAVLSAAEPAASDPPSSVRLTLAAGAEKCISEEALAKAVALRLGATARPDRTVEGRLERSQGKATFRARLALIGPNGATVGTREIWTRSPDCRAMDGDLALVAALLLDPEGPFPVAPPPSENTLSTISGDRETVTLTAPADTSDSPANNPSPPPPSDADSPIPPSISDPPPRLSSAVVRGGPVFSMGLFPAIGTGVAARVELTPRGLFPLEIGAIYWTEQHVKGGQGAFGADLWIAYGALALCPVHGEEAGFQGAACAGVEIGAAHVDRMGALPQTSSTTDSPGPAAERFLPFASVALGARVRRSIVGPLYLGTALDLSVPLFRPELYYARDGVPRAAFIASPVVGALELSVGLRLQ